VRLPAKLALLVLSHLVLVAVFADLLASESPLLVRHAGSWWVLPGVTAPAAWGEVDPAALDSTSPALWAPVRARPALTSGASGAELVSLCIHGSRSIVITTLGVLALALALGVPLGALAGRGVVWDGLLSRAVELTGALPSLVVVAALATGHAELGWLGFVIVLGALRGVEIARLVRGEVLRVSGTEFVLAARALGGSPLRVVARHVLPHVWGPVIVSATFTAAGVVALEAALSYLGLGLPDDVPSWGRLLGHAGRGIGVGAALAALLAILVTTACLYVVADALDDHLSARRGGASRV